MLRRSQVFLVGLAVMVLAGCGEDPAHQEEYFDKPSDGWVQVSDSLYKKCDGGHLVYWATGYQEVSISVVRDAGECGAT